jgi:DNA-directed RNA polymerase subunit RPC12/RpoP
MDNKRRIPVDSRMQLGRVLMSIQKIKVKIRCRQCGERFILKGKKDKGKIETGFRQCICNNEHDFDIESDYR